MESFRQVSLSVPDTGEEEWHALREPIESGWLTQGPKVLAFEEAFAARHEVKHAIAATSGTTALHLALVGLGIGPGDEVIVPGFTWVASANVVAQVGATPVFVDVSPTSFNIDVEQMERAISPQTKAVIAVHLFGLCADIDRLKTLLPDGVVIIEDAACAAGAAYHGRPAGSLGDIAAFSFHPRKSITTGEGGMVTVDNDDVAVIIRAARNHGLSVMPPTDGPPPPFMMPDVEMLGFNYRMTDIQAAIGLVQLTKLDRLIDERAELAKIYAQDLNEIPWLQTPCVPEGVRHAWQAYVVVIDEESSPISRNRLMTALAERGVATRPGTQAVSALAYYRDRPGARTCVVAERLYRTSMAIPLHNRMDVGDVKYVIESVRHCAATEAA